MADPVTAAEVSVVCPLGRRFPEDKPGCGATFTAAPDDEGFFDCPSCGLFFRAEAAQPVVTGRASEWQPASPFPEDQNPAGDPDVVVIQSHGMGVESQAILERWYAEPASRPFRCWSQLIVITAQVGEEHKNDTIPHMEARALPMLREKGVRFVEVARRGPYEADGIVVLQDTRNPQKLHPDGVYKLSDELLRSGTVPQFGGEHRCAMKFKAFVIEAWLAFEFQRQPTDSKPAIHVFGYNAEEVRRIRNSDTHIRLHNEERSVPDPKIPLMVFGFNSEEVGRIERARKYDGPSRIGLYPMQDWEWNRETGHAYILEKSGINWTKSHCSFCPFCSEAYKGLPGAVKRWEAAPEQTAHGLLVEYNSLCFNPRGQLYRNTSMAQAVLAKQGCGTAKVLIEFEALLNKQKWAFYRVKRIYTKKGKALRCVERLLDGTRAEMQKKLCDHGDAFRLETTEYHGITYRYFDKRAEGVYPTVEGFYVIAPAFMETKVCGDIEKFHNRYAAVRSGDPAEIAKWIKPRKENEYD